MEEGQILRSVLRLVLDPPQLVLDPPPAGSDDDKCSLCLFHYRPGDLIWCNNCNLRPRGVVQFNISPRLFYARDLTQDLQPDVVNVHEAPDILLFDADLD